MKWTTTADAAMDRVKLLVHGPPGVGKTRLCATTGDHEGTMIVSAEAGLLSLADFDIRVATVNSIDDVREVVRYLRSDANEFRWVCVDSISEIAEVCLADLKAKHKDPRAAYGELSDTMHKVVRTFRDLPMHVYMSAKQQRAQDIDGRIMRCPSMPGKQLTHGLAYHFDEVFAYCTATQEDGTIARWLQTANDGMHEAKDRSGKLDASEWPDLGKIVAKIQSTKTN